MQILKENVHNLSKKELELISNSRLSKRGQLKKGVEYLESLYGDGVFFFHPINYTPTLFLFDKFPSAEGLFIVRNTTMIFLKTDIMERGARLTVYECLSNKQLISLMRKHSEIGKDLRLTNKAIKTILTWRKSHGTSR